MDRRLTSVKKVVHLRSPYNQTILCLVALVYMSYFFFVSSRVDWSNAAQGVLPKIRNALVPSAERNLNLNRSQPSSLKNMVTDCYLLWCRHFCPSGVLYLAKTSKKWAVRVSSFAVYIHRLREAGWLADWLQIYVSFMKGSKLPELCQQFGKP